MRVLISDSHKYIYHMNPKVGSNTTLTVLYRLAGIAEAAIGNPHQVSRNDELMQKHGLKAVDIEHADCQDYFAPIADYYTFSFTRNPFTRLKSAYNDKLKRYAEAAEPKLVERLSNVSGVEITKSYFQRELKKHISFDRFARDVCNGHLYTDQHWVPQYDRLRPDLCRYDRLGKLENYQEDLFGVLLALGIDESQLPKLPSALNSAPDPKGITDYYDEELINLVCNTYRRDFTEFGYDMVLPVQG